MPAPPPVKYQHPTHIQNVPPVKMFVFFLLWLWLLFCLVFSRTEKRERDGESPCRGTRMMGWEDEGDKR